MGSSCLSFSWCCGQGHCLVSWRLFFIYIEYNVEFTEDRGSSFLQIWTGAAKFRAKLSAGIQHTLKSVNFQPRNTDLGFWFLQERRGEMIQVLFFCYYKLLLVETEFKLSIGCMVLYELLVLFTLYWALILTQGDMEGYAALENRIPLFP